VGLWGTEKKMRGVHVEEDIPWKYLVAAVPYLLKGNATHTLMPVVITLKYLSDPITRDE
jgi:hypothetical protein